jgi:hypothetical protein
MLTAILTTLLILASAIMPMSVNGQGGQGTLRVIKRVVCPAGDICPSEN